MSKKVYAFCPYCQPLLNNAFIISPDEIKENAELRNGILFILSDVQCATCHNKIIEVREPDVVSGDVREVPR